jgi:hypothetical protein
VRVLLCVCCVVLCGVWISDCNGYDRYDCSMKRHCIDIQRVRHADNNANEQSSAQHGAMTTLRFINPYMGQ